MSEEGGQDGNILGQWTYRIPRRETRWGRLKVGWDIERDGSGWHEIFEGCLFGERFPVCLFLGNAAWHSRGTIRWLFVPR